MKWADVKVGDQVIINSHARLRLGRRIICQVERVTATQFIADGYRFRKSDGWQVNGDDCHSSWASVATPESIKIVQSEQRYGNAQDNLRRQLNSLDTLWREIDRNHDSYKWAATLEKALLHLTAAAEVLKVEAPE